MSTTVLRTLLWKDYRQNRQLLVVAITLPVMCFLIAWLFFVMVLRDLGSPIGQSVFFVACSTTLAFSSLIVAMLGGTIIAADRPDRSAAFMAYLPPSRGMILLSKALCAGSMVCLLLIYNIVVFMLNRNSVFASMLQWESLLIIGSTWLLLFGAAWIAGSLVGNPGIATGIGIGFPVVLAIVLTFVANAPGAHPDVSRNMPKVYGIIASVTGLLCFAAGCLHSLYRKADV